MCPRDFHVWHCISCPCSPSHATHTHSLTHIHPHPHEQPSDSRLVVQAGMTLGEIVARFAARGHSIHYGEDESRTLIGLAQSGEHVSSQRYHGFATMIAGFTIVAADGKAYVAHRSSNSVRRFDLCTCVHTQFMTIPSHLTCLGLVQNSRVFRRYDGHHHRSHH